ncbi:MULTISPECIES: FliI/YscN family ATPase [Dyella]|uniref:protein-secreting ATPase n=2 Tax=Dyella TaxID=231454 RepID=A0A4R0YWB0_9GAMM|nr:MULTISPECIES: FliI/YscN family ATPase [Dyella]TBR38727.1 FliI/YscN family ATPase [Dyella terrae]TCI13682.1 FliI/YscN family ATPase [Dyella soli]
MKLPSLLARVGARPHVLRSGTLRVLLDGLRLGEICELLETPGESAALRGIVTSIDGESASVAVLGESQGLSSRTIVMPTGRFMECSLHPSMLGGVYDAMGKETARLTDAVDGFGLSQVRTLKSPPADYRCRTPIGRLFHTGIRAIDGLLACGEGQRMGIFAPAGCGKTSLLEMMLDYVECDVIVLALIGERGRELSDAVERLRQSPQAGRVVIVHATSDCASALRCQAALLATTVAEYFRDRGNKVLLLVDSMTRYARALRDMALASGEPPARRGFPASVFDALPGLLERPGAVAGGSITAFYTVLLEDEALADPIGEEVKSLLDGHIYLSSSLAGKGHYPAIDVLRSQSRLFSAVTDPQHQMAARRFRHLLAVLAEMQVLRDVGEYVAGQNAIQDAAVERESAMEAFLQQRSTEGASLQEALMDLYAAVR